MRPDMNKLLVERPRTGGGYLKPKKGYRDFEEAPDREPIKTKTGGWNHKQLNENLAPLRRFLRSRVGRPWDKVYSEIRADLDMDNTIQRHIMQHLWGYVSRHVEVTKEGVFRTDSTFRFALRNGDLYVCPKTGLLKEVKIKAKASEKPRETFRRINKHQAAILKDEIWYEVALAPLPKTLLKRVYPGHQEYVTYYYESVIDALTHESAALRTWGGYSTFPAPCDASLKLYGDGFVYATKVRQMGSREIRKLGL